MNVWKNLIISALNMQKLSVGKSTQEQRKGGDYAKKNSDGSYTISISSRLLADDVADYGAIDTIIHELLHTVKGCMNHKEPWKREADKVNRAYGYNIKRTATCEECGVEPIEDTPQEIKYQFKCKDCGKVYSRTRASRFTKNWQNYRCGVCGGEFTKTI